MINKEYVNLEQKYNDLLNQHKKLDDRVNRMIEEKYNLARECEKLENKIKKLRKNLILEIEINDRYRKAITEIKEIAEFNYRPYNVCGEYNESCIVLTNILNIIKELKEEK